MSEISFPSCVKCTAIGVCQSSVFSLGLCFMPKQTCESYIIAQISMLSCVCVFTTISRLSSQHASFCPAAKWKITPWHGFSTEHTHARAHTSVCISAAVKTASEQIPSRTLTKNNFGLNCALTTKTGTSFYNSLITFQVITVGFC